MCFTTLAVTQSDACCREEVELFSMLTAFVFVLAEFTSHFCLAFAEFTSPKVDVESVPERVPKDFSSVPTIISSHRQKWH
jgi:hypothetical protein